MQLQSSSVQIKFRTAAQSSAWLTWCARNSTIILLFSVILISLCTNAICVLASDNSLPAPRSISPSDPRAILLDLWSSTGGPQWSNATNWNTNAPICSWHGIICDQNQSVVKISLNENNLVGILPTSLSNLTSLQALGLGVNNINGPLPAWMCQSLQLTIIDLRVTNIAGAMLDCWQPGAALAQLILENTAVNGSLPASIGNLRNLTNLELRRTQLTGAIPDSWKNLASLERLMLADCPIQGTIPKWLGSLPRLAYLHLDNTQITGGVPVELGNLVNLVDLVLSNNPGLTGPLPAELGNLNSLQALLLSTTGLSGEIPSSFTRLSNLTVVAIDSSGFTGNPFPSLPIGVLDLSIASSQFVATLDSPDFCKLTRLQIFISSYSLGLSGHIPACVGNMTQLTSVYVDHCYLSGHLPLELFSLAGLRLLDLRNNAFSGPIPNEFGQLTQLNQVDFSNNYLKGTFPQTISHLTQLTLGAFGNNNLEGEFDLAWLPQSVQVLDLHANYLQFSALTTCAAAARSIRGYTGPTLSLAELVLSVNPINLPLGDVMKCLTVMTPSIITLLLDSNELFGGLEFTDIGQLLPAAGGTSQWVTGFSSLVTITLSDNLMSSSSAVNTLAEIGTLLVIDVSDNRMSGSIDSVASNAQRVLLRNNPDLRGVANYTAIPPGWGPRFLLPSFVSKDESNFNRNDTLALMCPAFIGSIGQEIQMDPSYLNYQHCQCLEGYRTTAPEGNWCEPCPSELSCSDLMYAPVHAVNNGFYPSPLPLSAYNDDSSLLLSNAVMVPCQYAQRCNPHTKTQYQCADGSDPDTLLCSRCLPGFFEADGACQECASWARWLVPIILTLCAAGFILIQIGLFVAEERAAGYMERINLESASSRIAISNDQKAESVSLQVENRNFRSSTNKPKNEESTSTLMIILTFWLQSQHTLSSISAVGSSNGNSDGRSNGWMHYISSTASLTPLGLECIVYGWDWPSQWWLIVTSPVWMILLASSIYFVGHLHPLQSRLGTWLNLNQSAESMSNSISTAWRRICFHLLLSLWSLTYMGVAQMILSSWNCEKVTTPDAASSFSFVTAAPYVNCGSRQHTTMLAVGITMFVSFTLFLPATMMWYSRKQRQHSSVRLSTSAASFSGKAHEMQLQSNTVDESGERNHGLVQSLLDSSMQVHATREEDESLQLHSSHPSTFNLQYVLATTACSGLRSPCWQWQSVITGRKLLLAAIVALMPRGSSIAPLLAIVMLLALLLSHTWIRPFHVSSGELTASNWLMTLINRMGRDFNLLEACLLLQISALFLAQVLSAAASTQRQLLEAGASLRTQAGVVPTLLNANALGVVREIILGIGITIVSIVVMQAAWRFYKKWQKTRGVHASV